MIKKTILATLSVFLLLYVGWASYNQLYPRKVSIHARAAYGHLKTLNEVENVADTIVKVKILDNRKQFYRILNDAPASGYTVTQAEIIKVYKSKQLSEKNIIAIVEPYYYYTYPVIALKDMITTDNYIPLKNNKQYILFMNEYIGKDINRVGSYEIIDSKLGKYVSKSEISNKNADKFSNDELETYEFGSNYTNIIKEVYEKFED